jgi:hypothetical protein
MPTRRGSFVCLPQNAFIDLLVEVAESNGTDSYPPKGLGDVLYPANRDTGWIHLDQGLLYGGLSKPVPLNDGRLKLVFMEFGNLQGDFPGLGVKASFLMPCSGIFPGLGPFIGARITKLISFCVQELI